MMIRGQAILKSFDGKLRPAASSQRVSMLWYQKRFVQVSTTDEIIASGITQPKRATNPNWQKQQVQIRKSLGLPQIKVIDNPSKNAEDIPIKKEIKKNRDVKSAKEKCSLNGLQAVPSQTNSNRRRQSQFDDEIEVNKSLPSHIMEEETFKLTETLSSPLIDHPNRPFSLPPGEFRPKQSLGQNYLSDQNYVNKIVQAFEQHRMSYYQAHPLEHDELGSRVVEIGPGLGALSRVLHPQYPDMTAVEIDQRAVAILNEKLPNLRVVHQDVLTFDWRKHSEKVGGKLLIVANLPYHIVSQVLFSLADASEVIAGAVVTMQYEVAERITAPIKTKDYGIPSVVFQLYGKTQLLFKIPPTVFYPVPNVDSALISVDFTKASPAFKKYRVNMERLRLVVSTVFRQRRKMLRQSLKSMLQAEWVKVLQQNGRKDKRQEIYNDFGLLRLDVPSPWAELRPEHITPEQFVELTVLLFGEVDAHSPRPVASDLEMLEEAKSGTHSNEETLIVHSATWRRSKEKGKLLAAPSNSERRRIRQQLELLQNAQKEE